MKKYLLLLIFVCSLVNANVFDKFECLRCYDGYVKAGIYGGLVVVSGVASCCLLRYSKNIAHHLHVPDCAAKCSSLLPLIPAGLCLFGAFRECQLQRTSNSLTKRKSTPDSKYV